MENPCKIVFFGDSITLEYTLIFEKKFRKEYPEIELKIINAGVVGETSRDGLLRVDGLVAQSPEIVVIGFGMNDWRRGVDKKEYKKNLIIMLEKFESIGTRVIINTVNPSYNFEKRKYNYEVNEYSEIVRNIAYEKRIKIADINAAWKREFKRPQKGLRDELHPNSLGYEIIYKTIKWVISRKSTTILWQYNGHEAKCNFRCPYCYYIGMHSSEDRDFGTIREWHDSLKASFGNQSLYLYLGFGEPTLGKKFIDIIDMIESEPNWQLRIVSNIATKEVRIAANTQLAKEGRLHIVSSFHPSMISREKHLDTLLYLRERGIEVPTVYVGYPPYLKHFKDDIEYFRKHGFLVHVRRFAGEYKGKEYPIEYTEEERILFGKYQDNGMLKYMQSDIISHGELTYSGFSFFVMDSVGNMGYDSDLFQPYTKYRCIFGNIHQRNFKPLLLPGLYPGKREGTDDGISNVIKYGYKELEGNHVTSFARQGGVFKDEDGSIVYCNEKLDFTDLKIRKEFNFPPRNIVEFLQLEKPARKRYVKKIVTEFSSKVLNTKTKNAIKIFIKKGKQI